MVNLGGLVGYRYSPPSPPSHYPYPGYTPPLHCRTGDCCTPGMSQYEEAVGLISVAQLTLRPVFSEIRVITEVYNLLRIDNR